MINLLVIEDSPMQVQLIEGLLAKAADRDFTVSVANDLASALAQLGDTDFDAVLLDLSLPDSGGIESCQRVHEVAPATPIVVLSGNDDEKLAIATMQYGAQDYLVKGDIGNQLLVRAIRYAIERQKSELALRAAHDELELRVERRTAELKAMQEEAVVRREELAHASRLNTLGEMASGLAHELNQPLMAIIGFTDHCLHMLDTKKVDRELFREILQDTSNEAKRAGEIIKRMRRLVTKREVQRSPTDLNDTIAESVQLLRPGLNVEVETHYAAALPDVSIDRIQIQQVVLNLARNAVQAMDDADVGGRRLTLITGRDDSGLWVEVSDTGPGLSQEDMERLFHPFFSRKPDGLGLGLSISRTIVESHGGQLTVARNGTGGLTFRLSLPLDEDS